MKCLASNQFNVIICIEKTYLGKSHPRLQPIQEAEYGFKSDHIFWTVLYSTKPDKNQPLVESFGAVLLEDVAEQSFFENKTHSIICKRNYHFNNWPLK